VKGRCQTVALELGRDHRGGSPIDLRFSSPEPGVHLISPYSSVMNWLSSKKWLVSKLENDCSCPLKRYHFWIGADYIG
jgi:hypothetical protein